MPPYPAPESPPVRIINRSARRETVTPRIGPIGSPILPIETRRIKARYGPIEVQRLSTMQGIAEKTGEFIKRHGGLANGEDHRIGEGAQTPLRIFRQVELGLMTADVVISPL